MNGDDSQQLDKFKKIIEISQEVSMERIAKSLRISEDELFEKLIMWGSFLPLSCSNKENL